MSIYSVLMFYSVCVFALISEVLWMKSRCRLSDGNAEFTIPQELYSEQVLRSNSSPRCGRLAFLLFDYFFA